MTMLLSIIAGAFVGVLLVHAQEAMADWRSAGKIEAPLEEFLRATRERDSDPPPGR